MITDDLIPDLVRATGAWQSRDRRWNADCPYCGKAAKRGQVHFSFWSAGMHGSKAGFKCWNCGEGGGLGKLAKQLGLLEGERRPVQPVQRPAPPPIDPERDPARWLNDAERIANSYLTADRFERWSAYKPIPRDVVDWYRLGYGSLPVFTSRCPHPRLIVPLICGGRVVGLRARRVDCECGEKSKWLSASGSKPILYNAGWTTPNPAQRTAARIGDSRHPYAAGRVVFIVENPIDALMLENVTEERYYAFATLGVTNWREEWTFALQNAKPKLVVIAYDHDIAGNGGSTDQERRQMEADWMQKNPKSKTVPIPNGIRLANTLLESGIPARVYRWPAGTPMKYDIGELLKDGQMV